MPHTPLKVGPLGRDCMPSENGTIHDGLPGQVVGCWDKSRLERAAAREGATVKAPLAAQPPLGESRRHEARGEPGELHRAVDPWADRDG